MLLYIAVALWPLLMEELYNKINIRTNVKNIKLSTCVFLALLPMFLMIALRNPSMGADTGGYIKNFLNVINTSLENAYKTTRMEHGYLIFVKCIGYITSSALAYQVICTTVYFIGIYSFTKNLEKEDAFLFVFFVTTLGLFFFMFTGVRQCLAMSICLFSYKYCKNRNPVKFFLCIILAYCFHKSACLFAIVYFIVSRKIKWYNILIYGILVWLASTYLLEIQEWFNETLEYNYEIEETGSGFIFFLITLAFTVFSMYVIYNNNGLTKYNTALININFITVFFWLLRLQTRVAERPSMYFMFISCALYSTSLNNIKNKREKLVLRVLIVAFSLAYYAYKLTTNASGFVPYKIFSL